jgi:Putative peptidoglycan binding domain
MSDQIQPWPLLKQGSQGIPSRPSSTCCVTAAAVRGFQQALGITVDGIVGPLTWRALVSGMLSF